LASVGLREIIICARSQAKVNSGTCKEQYVIVCIESISIVPIFMQFAKLFRFENSFHSSFVGI